MAEEEWVYSGNNPNWQTNFKCKLVSNGKWEEGIYGKWIFLAYPKGSNTAPCFADQNNFMSGLLECEWRNDNFIFPNGLTRCSKNEVKPTHYFLERLRLFNGVLNFYRTKYNGQTKLDKY